MVALFFSFLDDKSAVIRFVGRKFMRHSEQVLLLFCLDASRYKKRKILHAARRQNRRATRCDRSRFLRALQQSGDGEDCDGVGDGDRGRGDSPRTALLFAIAESVGIVSSLLRRRRAQRAPACASARRASRAGGLRWRCLPTPRHSIEPLRARRCCAPALQ